VLPILPLPDPSLIHPKDSFEERFSKIHNKKFNNRAPTPKPSAFETLSYVPSPADKTEAGQRDYVRLYEDFNRLTGRTAPVENKLVVLPELDKILKGEELPKWHLVLKNKDISRVSVRQIQGLTKGGMRLGGLSGDHISRITGLWPET